MKAWTAALGLLEAAVAGARSAESVSKDASSLLESVL
jgi:hypothetical protein